MGAAQRRKGASAERELANLLADRLGESVVRNLEQTRSGGHDLIGVDPFAIEVKRCETLSIPAWWRQACAQCDAGQVPVLAYRQSRRPWAIVLPLRYLVGAGSENDHLCQIDLDGFCLIAREVLSAA
mgnify:CR=1 FL=1